MSDELEVLDRVVLLAAGHYQAEKLWRRAED